MRKDANFNLPNHVGGFRKESVVVQKMRTILAPTSYSEGRKCNESSIYGAVMGFTHEQFQNLHERYEVGNKKTNPLEQKIMDLGKVMGEKTIGSFETKENTAVMSDGKIENGVESRNSTSAWRSEVGNSTANSGSSPVRYKDLCSASSNA